MATAPGVREARDGCTNSVRVVVETTGLDFVDSHGLLAVIGGRDRYGQRLELVPGKAMDRLLDLTDLRDFFGVR